MCTNNYFSWLFKRFRGGSEGWWFSMQNIISFISKDNGGWDQDIHEFSQE